MARSPRQAGGPEKHKWVGPCRRFKSPVGHWRSTGLPDRGGCVSVRLLFAVAPARAPLGAAAHGRCCFIGEKWRPLVVYLESEAVATKRDLAIEGTFQYLIFSPKGSVEGVLLEVANEPAQIVFERDDETSAGEFTALKKGQNVVLRGRRQRPSAKGESDHAVFGYVRLIAIDGRKPAKRKPQKRAAFTGVVARFNYARHGEANGVVLDTGDFIHTKPHGLVGLKLAVGDKVSVDGDARPLEVGAGRVVDAERVNGKRVRA